MVGDGAITFWKKIQKFRSKILKISQMLSGLKSQQDGLFDELLLDLNTSRIHLLTIAQVGIMAIQVTLFEELQSWDKT